MKRTLTVVACGCVLLQSTFATAQNLLPFEPLQGPYTVGKAEYVMTDTSRKEVFSEEPDDLRRLLVTVYYPASVSTDAVPSPYIDDGFAAAVNAPQSFRKQASLVHNDAPVTEGRFPVLVFSPAFGAITLYYSSLLAQLASEGYVVAAIWHPYSTSVTLLPDGTEIRRNDAGTPGGETLEEQMSEIARIGSVWVADMRFVLTQLQQWNTEQSPLAGHLDFERVGILGHSLGGAAAVEAAYHDDRFDAALNMDGTMFGEVATAGSRVPFLLLQGDPPPPTDGQLADIGVTREVFDAEEKILDDAVDTMLARSADASRQLLRNSRHNTYQTDQLFFSPMIPAENRTRVIGNMEPMEAYRQILQWVSAFMTENVKGR